MSLIKSNSCSIMLLYDVNLIALKSVDGRVNDLLPSSAGTGFESPRQHPRSSLRLGVKCRQIQVPTPIPRVGASRRKKCPLFNSAGVCSVGRLGRVVLDSQSRMVYRNEDIIPVNRLTPTV